MARLILLVALMVLTVPLVCSAQGQLILAAAVCVDTPVITLGQLARAEGKDAEQALARIGSEPLLAAPKFDGARANLSGPKMRELILQRFGADLPVLNIPDQIQVQRGGQVVDTLALRPEIDKILTQNLAPFEGDVEIRDHRLAEFLFIPDSSPVQMRVTPVGALRPGRISLRLDAVTADGKIARSFTGTAFADVWKTVPCAARVLNRGDILEAETITFARKNLAYLSRLPWDGHGLPLRMAAAVGKDQVIFAHVVEPIPVVQKGAPVTLVYAGQTLTLSVPAESLEDGGIGTMIRVRNIQSKKIVTARVFDAETVRTP